MEQAVLLGILIAFAVALMVTALIHPRVANFAKKRNIVDNPNARKLQRNPVPVMGGVAVFFGLVSGLCISGIFVNVNELLPIVVAMSVMLCVGVIDDACHHIVTSNNDIVLVLVKETIILHITVQPLSLAVVEPSNQ